MMSAPPEDGVSAARPGLRSATVLLWAAWFGLVGGGLELAVFLVKCNLLDPRNYNVSRHFVWMVPLAGLVVVGVPGVVVAVAAWLRPGRVPAGVVAGVLTFAGGLGVVFRGPISTVACLLLAGGLAVQAGRFLGARAPGFDRMVRRTLPALCALLAATVAVSCGRGLLMAQRSAAGRPRPPAGARNVLLIVLDTVRADRLGLYGHDRDTSPCLARLAARGVRFDRALATAPWTAPSHASMFTGRWAGELSVGWGRPLDRSCPTLAGFLGSLGYDTAGFVANTTYCSYETGLDRGFDRYDDYDVSPRAVVYCSAVVQRVLNFAQKHPALARRLDGGEASSAFRKSAARINADFLAWVSGHGARPFFAFLNYYDVHHPYLPPESWQGGPPGRRPESPADYGLLRSWWRLDKRHLGPRQLELASDSYDRCIAYLDAQLGCLFEELDRRGVLRDTLVIVTADHGEHLGEQHLYGHGVSLYRPELHVPLIVVDPGRAPAGRVVGAPVSLRDLAATVVERLGVGPEASPFPGRSLARAWSGAVDVAAEPLRSDVEAAPEDDPNRGASPARRGPMTSLVADGLHYIHNGDGREELFDLAADPHEAHDLAAAADSAVALRAFRARLRR
jgi:arylsulfatase A-like enzyme